MHRFDAVAGGDHLIAAGLEIVPQRCETRFVVLCQQNERPKVRVWAGRSLDLWLCLLQRDFPSSVKASLKGPDLAQGTRERPRKGDRKTATLVGLAFYRDAPLMELHNSSYKGQAQARPGVAPRQRALDLDKGLKKLMLIFGGDANTRIGDH